MGITRDAVDFSGVSTVTPHHLELEFKFMTFFRLGTLQ